MTVAPLTFTILVVVFVMLRVQAFRLQPVAIRVAGLRDLQIWVVRICRCRIHETKCDQSASEPSKPGNVAPECHNFARYSITVHIRSLVLDTVSSRNGFIAEPILRIRAASSRCGKIHIAGSKTPTVWGAANPMRHAAAKSDEARQYPLRPSPADSLDLEETEGGSGSLRRTTCWKLLSGHSQHAGTLRGIRPDNAARGLTTEGPLMVSKFPALEINARLPELMLALLFCIASCKSSVAAEAARVDMTPERWLADGKVSFRTSELYPHGVMQVTGAGAVLKDTTFGNGTIEYDINEDGDEQETSGIWFRRQSAEVAESFYLRPFADCASTAECVQYAPVSRGNVQWDVYPEYEAAAPVKLKGWNHVKLVISGKRMNVFINREAKPSMVVGCLGGESPTGAVQLRGNALYANLTLAPDLVEGLNEEPLEDPTDKDPRFVRHWRLAPILSLPRGQSPELSAMPVESLSWRPIDAERKGFVNIGRGNGTPQGVPDLAWLKTNIQSERAQTRHAAIGWVRQIWVYVNGRQVFAGNNVYYPESARTPPLGRLSLGNGSFDLPLRKGPNEVDVAISDDLGHIRHWGWGYQLRLDDIQGIGFPSDNRAHTSATPSDVNQ
jgi:hypothetical protein